MRYLKPKGLSIKIGDEVYKIRYTLDIIDELQDKTGMPLPEIISMLTGKKHRKTVVQVLLKYLIGQEIEIEDDKLEYYSMALIEAYIEQSKSKPYEGEKKGKAKEGFEFINIEKLYYIATKVLGIDSEKAWGMTIGAINTLHKEDALYNGLIKEDKEMNVDDVIPY